MNNKTHSNDIDEKISSIESQIRELRKTVSDLRRERPTEEIADILLQAQGGPKRLSEFFGTKDSMIVIHNMGSACSYCTLWADTLNGMLPHIENRTAFLVTTPDKPSLQAATSMRRGWQFSMASTDQTTFAKDLQFETEEGLVPGFSVLMKDSHGKISRTARGEFGPFDEFCGLWHLFAALPDGVNGWTPKKAYTGKQEDILVGQSQFSLAYVDDLSKAEQFYTKYFGFKRQFLMDDGSIYGQLGLTGLWIGGGYAKSNLNINNTRSGAMFSVVSPHKLFDQLKLDGVSMVQEAPVQMNGGQYWFQLRDPAGNIVEVLGPGS